MTLRAGAAAVEINPSGPVPLFGYPHVPRVSAGVHDPVLASALYLENEAEAAVLVALDLLMIDPPTARGLRQAIARRTGIPEPHVFISCTHTHSGPVTSELLAWHGDPAVPPPDPVYLEFARQQAVEAAAKALADRQPVEIAWTTADAMGIGGNRLSAGGLTDPEAGVLVVRQSGGGRILALAVVYGMHATVLHEDSTLVSSDFVHYARQELRERYGPSLPAVYHTAPCGDQSPRRFVRGQTFGEAERLGRALGRAVAAAVEGLGDGDFRDDGAICGLLRQVELPRRPLPTPDEAERLLACYRAEYARLQSEQADPADVRTAQCAVFGAEGSLTLARLQQSGRIDATLRAYRPIEVQALRIGDGFLAGLPGELFTEYSLELKRRGPRPLSVVSLVNGHLQGYLVTAEAAQRGGYEAMTSVFDGPQAASLLIEAALELLARLKEEPCRRS